jgi:hypothetical protein
MACEKDSPHDGRRLAARTPGTGIVARPTRNFWQLLVDLAAAVLPGAFLTNDADERALLVSPGTVFGIVLPPVRIRV